MVSIDNKENNLSVLESDSEAFPDVVNGDQILVTDDQLKKNNIPLKVDNEIFLDILMESITGVCLPKTRIPGFSRVNIKF